MVNLPLQNWDLVPGLGSAGFTMRGCEVANTTTTDTCQCPKEVDTQREEIRRAATTPTRKPSSR
eukprot:1180370-Prorocentrum_minimum.AAC.5